MIYTKREAGGFFFVDEIEQSLQSFDPKIIKII